MVGEWRFRRCSSAASHLPFTIANNGDLAIGKLRPPTSTPSKIGWLARATLGVVVVVDQAKAMHLDKERDPEIEKGQRKLERDWKMEREMRAKEGLSKFTGGRDERVKGGSGWRTGVRERVSLSSSDWVTCLVFIFFFQRVILPFYPSFGRGVKTPFCPSLKTGFHNCHYKKKKNCTHYITG